MSTSKRLSRTWFQRREATSDRKKALTASRFRPHLEALEARELLDANPVFINGSHVTDASGATVAAPPTVTNLTDAGFVFTTPGDADVITIDSPGPGQNRISGTSGGTPFPSIT